MNRAVVQPDSPRVFHVRLHSRAEFDAIDLPVWDYRNYPIPQPLLVKELTDGDTAVLFEYVLTHEDLTTPLALCTPAHHQTENT